MSARIVESDNLRDLAADEKAVIERLRFVCSWCGKVLQVGSPGAPVSHGICLDCKDKFKGTVVDGPDGPEHLA